MAEKPLTAVLVGCGSISNAWLTPIAARNDITIVGLVDLQIEAVRKRANDHGLTNARVGTDLDQMLKELQPDVVLDCTIPEAHVKVTLTALANGCHVLGEKPMADTMANAKAMVDAAGKAGKTYAVLQNRRYQDNIRRVRQILGDSCLGAVHTLNCDFYLGPHFGGFRDVMDHVLLLDMAIHTFDAARYLLAGVDPVAVYCHEWNPRSSWYKHGASAVAIFEMSDGSVFTYRGSWCAEGLSTTWESDWRAVCANGSLRWDGAGDIRAETVIAGEGFTREIKPLEIPSTDNLAYLGHAGVIDDFVTAVRAQSTPMTVCTDNIKSLAMVHAAIASATQGCKVAI